MKKLILSSVVFATVLISSCGSSHDFTECEAHLKECPISEDCKHHPICEAHEHCAIDKDCKEHPTCEAFEKR